MRFHEMAAYDYRMKLRQPPVILALILYLCTLAYGAASGRASLLARIDAADQHRAEVGQARARLLGRVRDRIESGKTSQVPPWVGSAMDVTFASVLPPGALADFAIGQSDLLPSIKKITLWDPDVRLFSKYEFDDPVALATGAFDLTLAMVFVLPLVLIALCFDVLSMDTDHRRLGMVLAQGVSLRRMVWARVCARVSALAVPAVAVAACLLLATSLPIRSRALWFAIWALGTGAYACFWVVTVVAVAARGRSGQATALSLVMLWAVLVMLVPAAVTSALEAWHPASSRVAMLAAARGVESRALREAPGAAGRFMSDHPEISAVRAREVPTYIRTAYWVTDTIDRSTRPTLAHFENSARRRRATLSVLEYLSPAIFLYQLAVDSAGSSSERHYAYQQQSRAFKASFGAKSKATLLAGGVMSPHELESLPKIELPSHRLATVVRGHVGPGIFLSLLIVVLTRIANRRLDAIIGPSG